MILVVDKVIDRTETPIEKGRKFPVGKIIPIVLLLTIALFWIWALSPLAPSGHPDKLDDSSFATEAKILCGLAEEEPRRATAAVATAHLREHVRELLIEHDLIPGDDGTVCDPLAEVGGAR